MTPSQAEAGTVGANGRAPYESVTEFEWGRYLTLLNLRACEVINGKVRTEQIYVHSKLLIADDRHAIVGSANINDRSQRGDRDSEIAVLLMDDAHRETAILRDRPVTVHIGVRKLRMDLWKKHLALSVGGSSGVDGASGNGLVGPASSLSSFIDKPAASETISVLRGLAQSNADKYREAFPFVPWSSGDAAGNNASGASIWPTSSTGIDAISAAAQMPFDAVFWSNRSGKQVALSGLQGHFVSLPIYWTFGENNHPGRLSVMAVASASPASAPLPGVSAFDVA